MRMSVKELELYEVAFMLGYDLLHKALSESEDNETDLTYGKCLEIAEDFINSSYDRYDRSLYTCVCEYLMSEEFEKFEKKFKIYY